MYQAWLMCPRKQMQLTWTKFSLWVFISVKALSGKMSMSSTKHCYPVSGILFTFSHELWSRSVRGIGYMISESHHLHDNAAEFVAIDLAEYCSHLLERIWFKTDHASGTTLTARIVPCNYFAMVPLDSRCSWSMLTKVAWLASYSNQL